MPSAYCQNNLTCRREASINGQIEVKCFVQHVPYNLRGLLFVPAVLKLQVKDDVDRLRSKAIQIVDCLQRVANRPRGVESQPLSARAW